MADLVSLTPEASFSAAPTDTSSHVASLSSTPPTTVAADSISIASEVSKSDIVPVVIEDAIVAVPLVPFFPQLPPSEPAEPLEPSEPTEPTTPARARRARASAPIYNLAKLSGTDIHGKRRSKGDDVSDRRRRTISGANLLNGSSDSVGGDASQVVQDGIDALDMQWSINALNTPRQSRSPAKKSKHTPSPSQRLSRRTTGVPPATLATKLSTLGKRSRKALEKTADSVSRELRRLQDTNEFAHIDERPVRYTVWSNGKYVDPDEVVEEERPRKKAKKEEPLPEEEPVVEKEQEKPVLGSHGRKKKWMNKGLYAGQAAPLDPTKGLSGGEKKALAQLPELMAPPAPNKVLPFPLFNGLRLLIQGRDFKLPFDVCNPLPRGQPKPSEWKKLTRNRFVGDAQAYWRKADHSDMSMCVCKQEDGCGDDCQNRIMLYECDDSNCKLDKEHCTNRHFKDLSERTKGGGPYRVGVEVMKTEDRGYGVRTNRCFEANQIIVEYTGEIITDEECERRMNEVYKDRENYYLMSFEQNMILDATTGSIARFVNHSCEPNCRMRKWTVNGQPRVALFAGDRPIMTGEELTYDYKFAPFGKSMKECLCGSANCRGVLGPRQKEAKKETQKEAKVAKSVKASVKAGKRKLKELLDGKADENDGTGAKKRKVKTAQGAKGVKVKLAKSDKSPKSSKSPKSVKSTASTKTKSTKTKSTKTKSTKTKSTKTTKSAKQPATKAIKTVKKSLSSSSLQKAAKGAAKGAATVIKKSVSTISVNAKAALGPKKPKKATTVHQSSTTSVLKKYGKKQTKLSASSNSTLTIVAQTGKKLNAKPSKASASSSAKTASAKGAKVVKSKSIKVIFPKKAAAAATLLGKKSTKQSSSAAKSQKTVTADVPKSDDAAAQPLAAEAVQASAPPAAATPQDPSIVAAAPASLAEAAEPLKRSPRVGKGINKRYSIEDFLLPSPRKALEMSREAKIRVVPPSLNKKD